MTEAQNSNSVETVSTLKVLNSGESMDELAKTELSVSDEVSTDSCIGFQTVVENPQLSPVSDEIDLDSIRLTQHFSGQGSVKKLLNTVPVRKPNRTQFFRTHPEYRMDVMLLKYEETDELYVVKPEVFLEVSQLAKPHRLVLAVDRMGTPFIWPLAIPDPERPMAWHQSAMEADQLAQENWMRIQANQGLGAYELYQATAELSEPVWPTEPWSKLINIAFKQKLIDSADHIVLQKLRGEL